MNLSGIEFVSQTGFHVTIGAYVVTGSGKPCYWLHWEDGDGLAVPAGTLHATGPGIEVVEHMSLSNATKLM